MKIDLYTTFNLQNDQFNIIATSLTEAANRSDIKSFDLIKIKDINLENLTSDINKDKQFIEFIHENSIVLLNKKLLLSGGPISDVLNTSRRISQLPPSTKFINIICEPINLFNGDRFDLSYKTIFANHINSQNRIDKYYSNLYKEHLIRITGPGKIIKERDGTSKEGISQYISSFEALLKSNEIFENIPCGKNMVLFDGAHRVSSSITKNRPININLINTKAPKLNFNYLVNNRYGHRSIPESLQALAAHNIIKYNKLARCFVIFPSVNNSDYALNSIKDSFNVFFIQKLQLNTSTQEEVIRILYRDNKHITNASTKSNKQRNCFSKNGYTYFVFIKANLSTEINYIKEKIRGYYQLGNHSIHSTDNYKETLSISNFVLSPNFKLLNQLNPADSLKNLLEVCRVYLNNQGVNIDKVCVTGSCSLALFGERQPNDIDLIHPEVTLKDIPNEIGSHNGYEHLYPDNFLNILNNPQNFLVYRDFKFISPNILINFKKERNELKDQKDIISINKILTRAYQHHILSLRNVKILCHNTFQNLRLFLKKSKKLVKVYLKIKSWIRK